LQLVDSTRPWDVPATAYTIEDVLNGRVVWDDYVACLRPQALAGEGNHYPRERP
jgi:hypothetical protein